MMKILLTTVISGFLFISVPALTTDYSQPQNKADDKMNSSKHAQSNPADKNKNDGSSKEKDRDRNTEKKSQPETYEKQKVQKSEKDADPKGRIEENKENSDTEGPRGAGVQ